MRLLVLYGSQTGTAQDVAEQIWRESKQWGFEGPVLSLEDYNIQQLIEERLVIFVVATTGDGMEPDNMKHAWRFLLKRSLPSNSLQGLQFACLGLGDSSYSKFNYAAKKLHKRLLNLGATTICPLGLCDDQHDYGHLGTSLAWTAGLWQTLNERLAVHKSTEPLDVKRWNVRVLQDEQRVASDDRLQWTQKQPAHVFKLIENTRTTAEDHFQDVRLLRLGNNGGDMPSWQPGDVLDVQPHNSCERVEEFFELLKEHKLDFNANTLVEVSSAHKDLPLPQAYAEPITLLQAATYIWDLSAKPRQRFLEVLAQNCADEMEHEKLVEFCTAEGLDDLIAYVNRPRRTLLELLQDFRHATANLTLSQLFEMMPLIQVRSFSIASDASSGTLDLLVAVVNYKTIMHTPRLGLASNWLKNLQAGIELHAAIKPGTMSWPKELSSPLIMIGPGTGVAPFRSIIQNRLQKKADEIGQLVVYFGCRNKDKDYHFQEDFKTWHDNQTVEVHVAFSRDQESKIYVQHLIKENGTQLAKLIREQNAYIYVAGSSNNMPKAVREAFIEALDNDVNYLEQLIKQRRYQEETWA